MPLPLSLPAAVTAGKSPDADRGGGFDPRQIRILSLSCVYPNPGDPGLGLFVRARLQLLAKLAPVKVIAPVPYFDYAKRAVRTPIPPSRWDNAIEVLHPKWFYPPGGHAVNAKLLFRQLLPCVKRLRAQFNFDLIDAHFAFPDGIAASLLAQRWDVPFTVTLRGNETMHAQHAGRRSLMQWALTKAARVIAVSSKLADFAASLGVAKERIKVIPNGVDATVFYPREARPIREKLGLGAEKVVLSAGTLIERKGHHRVVCALAALRTRGINAKLLIAGGTGREGNYENEIRKEIENSGLASITVFLGEIPAAKLAEAMSAADVFCLASSREGWPNVIHEALACGTPVVATEAGAAHDLIPSSRFGTVVPIGDEAALTEALGQALAQEWDREAIAAWAHSRSWEQVAQEVLSEFCAVVSEKRKAVV